jgi:hypothetical protein
MRSKQTLNRTGDDRKIDLISCIHDALMAITNPRFFETERGFQGEFLAQLGCRFALSDRAILEQEYQKRAEAHGLTNRPDIIIHEPYDPVHHANRTEGNVAVIELKLRATEEKAADDFKNLSDMIDVLHYPLGIFINIDSAITYSYLVPENIRGRIALFAVTLHGGKVTIVEERPEDVVS